MKSKKFSFLSVFEIPYVWAVYLYSWYLSAISGAFSTSVIQEITKAISYILGVAFLTQIIINIIKLAINKPKYNEAKIKNNVILAFGFFSIYVIIAVAISLSVAKEDSISSLR